jgi:hypothetical protein
MTDSTSDSFLREVQSDLNRARLSAFGRRWGLPLALVLLAALGSVAILQFMHRQNYERALAAGVRYETALGHSTDGQTDAAREAFRQLAATGQDGYAALASLRLAVATNDINLYVALVGDAALDPVVRDVAAVLAGYRATAPVPGAVRSRLMDLAGGPKPWQYLAQEALALNAITAGLPDEARQMLQDLRSDPTLSPAAKSRAEALLATLPPASAPPVSVTPSAAPRDGSSLPDPTAGDKK